MENEVIMKAQAQKRKAAEEERRREDAEKAGRRRGEAEASRGQGRPGGRGIGGRSASSGYGQVSTGYVRVGYGERVATDDRQTRIWDRAGPWKHERKGQRSQMNKPRTLAPDIHKPHHLEQLKLWDHEVSTVIGESLGNSMKAASTLL